MNLPNLASQPLSLTTPSDYPLSRPALHRAERGSPSVPAAVPLDTVERALRALLGSEQVVAEAGRLEEFSRENTPYRQIPSFAVYPASTEEVQGVLALARKHDLPVWPVSTGKNWGYGAKTACAEGGITRIMSSTRTFHHVD